MYRHGLDGVRDTKKGDAFIVVMIVITIMWNGFYDSMAITMVIIFYCCKLLIRLLQSLSVYQGVS